MVVRTVYGISRGLACPTISVSLQETATAGGQEPRSRLCSPCGPRRRTAQGSASDFQEEGKFENGYLLTTSISATSVLDRIRVGAKDPKIPRHRARQDGCGVASFSTNTPCIQHSGSTPPLFWPLAPISSLRRRIRIQELVKNSDFSTDDQQGSSP